MNGAFTAAGRRAYELLLVDDSPGDVELTRQALQELGSACRLNVAPDGVEALLYLRKEGKYAHAPRPHLILLDLNLPRLSGHQVLAEIKNDADLSIIPVVVFSSSAAPHDVLQSSCLHANCYVQKPAGFKGFVATLDQLLRFWFETATLAARAD